MYFKGKYYFLSNMYPCDITAQIDEKEYQFSCVEAAFQASKCPNRSSEFVSLNGYEAKKLGNTRVFNTIILGVVATKMEFDKEVWVETIKNVVPPKTVDINVKAFEVGYTL